MSYSGDPTTDDLLELSETVIENGDLSADDVEFVQLVVDTAYGMFDDAARDAHQRYRDLSHMTVAAPRLDELDERGFVLRVKPRRYAEHI